MTPFILLGVIVGALLGLRWTVMALLPAGVVTLLAIGGAGLLLGSTLWWTASAILLFIVGLQSGYLAAAVLRYAAPSLFSAPARREFPAADKPRMWAP